MGIKTCCDCILPWFGGLYSFKDKLVHCSLSSSSEHSMPSTVSLDHPVKMQQECL